MEENTITLTEAEFNAKIEEAVNSATEKLVSKHNGEMATARKEIKALKDASKSQDEIKAEQDAALVEELNDLRAFKKGKVLEDRLAKEGMPSYFKNDSRLLNAKDEDFDKILKGVKNEYEATLPKGNQHSTVVKTGGKGATIGKTDDKQEVYGEFAESLKTLVGR